MFKYLLFFVLLSSRFENGYANSSLFSAKTNLKSNKIKQKEINEIIKKPKKHLKQKNNIKPILFSALGVSLVFFILRYRNYIFDCVHFYLKTLISEEQQKLLPRIEEFEKRDRLQTENKTDLKKSFDEQLKTASEAHKNESDLLKKRIVELEKKANDEQDTLNRLDSLEAGMRTMNPSWVKYKKSDWEKSFSALTGQLEAVLGLSGRALYLAVGIGPSLALVFAIYKFGATLKDWGVWTKDILCSPFSWYKRLFDVPSRGDVIEMLNERCVVFIDEIKELKTKLGKSNENIDQFIKNKFNKMMSITETWGHKFDNLESKINSINLSLSKFEGFKAQVDDLLEKLLRLQESFNVKEQNLENLEKKLNQINSVYTIFKEEVEKKDKLVNELLISFENFTKEIEQNNALQNTVETLEQRIKAIEELKQINSINKISVEEIEKNDDPINIKFSADLMNNLNILTQDFNNFKTETISSNNQDLQDKVGTLENNVNSLQKTINEFRASFMDFQNNSKVLKQDDPSELKIEDVNSNGVLLKETEKNKLDKLQNEVDTLKKQIKHTNERKSKRQVTNTGMVYNPRPSNHRHNGTRSNFEKKQTTEGSILLDTLPQSSKSLLGETNSKTID